MKITELIDPKTGMRPAKHWECVQSYGGCGEVYLEQREICSVCGRNVVRMVRRYDTVEFKTEKENNH